MKRYLTILFFALVLAAYAQERVVAEWDFTKGVVPQGEFGGILRKNAQLTKEGLSNKAMEDIDGGFQTEKVHPELIPQEGYKYTVELTTGKGDFDSPKNIRRFIIDNMNVEYTHANPLYNKGLIFYLEWNVKGKFYVMKAAFGFGETSQTLAGPTLKPATDYTLAVAFNGSDKMWFEVNGVPKSKQSINHQGPLPPTRIKTHIGDRMNSVHYPFDGTIRRVTLTAFPAALLDMSFHRLAFRRNEADAALQLLLHNTADKELSNVRLSFALGDRKEEFQVADVKPQSDATVAIPVETRLAVGKYPFTVRADYTYDGGPRSLTYDGTLLIGPVKTDRMPIIMMSYRDGFPEERLIDIGFNIGCRGGYTTSYLRNPDNPAITSQHSLEQLDRLLYLGFDAMDYTNTNGFVKDRFPRIAKDGKPYNPVVQVDAANPEACAIIEKGITRAITSLADHPAFVGMKINSEVRDRCLPSFTPLMTEAYKKATGCDIPAEATGRLPSNYQLLNDFPFTRIIPMDYPLFQFYRWWWLTGDGWNNMTGQISDCAKAIVKRPFITSHDPAVRVPPMWGDGGSVGYLGHWTYAYPDAINVGINTDEMQAMARGNKSQGIFNETQIICYRSKTAPVDEKVENPPAWSLEYPNAPYITIPPDVLRTAAWTQISRHVDGIMFHGYCSLLVDEVRKGDTGYQCTNLESAGVLKEILHKVVHPFGPVLKRLPEPKAQVGVLQSLAPVFFADRGSWGWSRGWCFNLNLVLQHANLQPVILYDEDIMRDGFGNLKVLFMPHCDILSEPIFKAVSQFQLNGGLIVSDANIVPGITPDIVIPAIGDSADPVAFNKTICDAALDIKEKLQGFVEPMVSTSDPELTTHYRQDGKITYLFAINGKRTFGDYFGPWKLVCEKGLPLQATLDIRCKAGAVYDLVEHKAVPFTSLKGSTRLELNYETTGGRLFMLLPTPIGKVSLALPKAGSNGKPFEFGVQVYDAKGRRMESMFPLEITVESPDGKTDDSMYATLRDGKYAQSITPPVNATPGAWRVTVTELASGKSATGTVAVGK